jgi:hypothetical protein
MLSLSVSGLTPPSNQRPRSDDDSHQSFASSAALPSAVVSDGRARYVEVGVPRPSVALDRHRYTAAKAQREEALYPKQTAMTRPDLLDAGDMQSAPDLPRPKSIHGDQSYHRLLHLLAEKDGSAPRALRGAPGPPAEPPWHPASTPRRRESCRNASTESSDACRPLVGP